MFPACNRCLPKTQGMLRIITPILALVAVAGLVAGCGGSSGGGAKSAASRHTYTPVRFAKCMRAHGVTSFPDPSSDSGAEVSTTPDGGASINGQEVNPHTWKSAEHTCLTKLPFAKPSQKELAQEVKQQLTMSKCIRAHGVPNYPDPVVRKGQMVVPNTPADSNPNSPAFQGALTACSKSTDGGYQIQKAG